MGGGVSQAKVQELEDKIERMEVEKRQEAERFKRFKDEYTTRVEEQLKQIEENKKQYEEENKRKDVARDKFNNNSRLISKDYINILKSELNKETLAYFNLKNEIYFQENNLHLFEQYFKESAKAIVEYEKVVNSVSETIKHTAKPLSLNNNNLINHLNILVLGRTGVGKSTLINSVLKLKDDKAASEGKGGCVTKEHKDYTSDVVKGLRLWDTRGIELNDNSIIKTKEFASTFIKEQTLLNDTDRLIHCIWYCVTGDRFEDCEKKLLRELMNTYEDDILPIIIVYTKAFDNNVTDIMIEEIRKIVQQRKIDIIPIIAKDYQMQIKKKYVTIEAENVDQLVNLTFSKAEIAVKSSSYASIKELTRQKYLKDAKERIESLTVITHDKIKKQLNALRNEKELVKRNEGLFKIMKLIVSYTLYYNEQTVKEISQDSSESITTLLEGEVFKWFQDFEEAFVKQYLDKKEKELTQKYINLLTEIEHEYKVFFQIRENFGQWHDYSKNEIELEMRHLLLSTMFEIVAEYLCNTLIEVLHQLLLNDVLSKALYKIQDVFDKNAKETTRQVIKNIYSISGYKMVENKECPPLNDSNDS